MLWGRTKESGADVHSLYWGQRDMNVSCERGKYYLSGEKVNLVGTLGVAVAVEVIIDGGN